MEERKEPALPPPLGYLGSQPSAKTSAHLGLFTQFCGSAWLQGKWLFFS